MSFDLDYIKENYSKMEDFKLERIAKYEVASLKPEVLPILISEIERRGLNDNLLKGIDSQVKNLSPDELNDIKTKIKGLACPNCRNKAQELNGGIIRRVRSYLIITQYEKNVIITCNSCLEKEQKSQLIKNSLLGWWGIPWGLIRTPMSIINHFRDNMKKEKLSELILIDFIKQNVGELRTNWEDEKYLSDFIKHVNSNNKG